MSMAHRFNGEGQAYEGLTRVSGGRPVWNGNVMLVRNKLLQPIRWQKPRRIFVNSMSDLHHDQIPISYVEEIYDVMRKARHHTFQVLTKRPEQMMKFIGPADPSGGWPLHNVWLGVTVENQDAADERIHFLKRTPSSVRFLSVEPMIGPINLPDLAGIQWVIVGGESGPRARDCRREWVDHIRLQCMEQGVAFFFKQLGNVWAKREGIPQKGGNIDDLPKYMRIREFPY